MLVRPLYACWTIQLRFFFQPHSCSQRKLASSPTISLGGAAYQIPNFPVDVFRGIMSGSSYINQKMPL